MTTIFGLLSFSSPRGDCDKALRPAANASAHVKYILIVTVFYFVAHQLRELESKQKGWSVVRKCGVAMGQFVAVRGF